MKHALSVIALAATLGGCGNFSGLDGSSSFTCKAPEGVSCTSVSGVYANSVANKLPAPTSTPVDKHAAPSKSDNPDTANKVDKSMPSYGSIASLRQAAPTSGDPVLSPPRILRIWLAPWEDQDGDLRDQSYLYVMWDRGEWNIQHSRSNLMNQYAPVSLLPIPASASPTTFKETPQQSAQSIVEKPEDTSTPEVGDAH